MATLTPRQRRYLKGLAHSLKPVVQIGQNGVTETVVRALEDALTAHELIKVQFVDVKEKDTKHLLAHRIESALSCEIVGTIGHRVIFYRPHKEAKKRGIQLPRC